MSFQLDPPNMESVLLQAIKERIAREGQRLLESHKKEIEHELSEIINQQIAALVLNLSSMVSFERMGPSLMITVHDNRKA